MKINILNRLSFAQKIWSGTLIFCMLLGVVAALMLNSQRTVSSSIRELLSHDMEVLATSMKLRGDIQAHSADLGLYLMSKDRDYLASMKRKASVIETDLKTLSTLDNKGNYSVGEKLQRISRAFRDIQRVDGEILSIASDPMRTIPGLKLAREQLAPLGVTATTALKNMQQTMLADGISE